MTSRLNPDRLKPGLQPLAGRAERCWSAGFSLSLFHNEQPNRQRACQGRITLLNFIGRIAKAEKQGASSLLRHAIVPVFKHLLGSGNLQRSDDAEA